MINKSVFLSLIIIYTILSYCYHAQNDITFIQKGSIKAMATLSPSKILSKNLSPFYLHGSLEYYIDNKVSIIGEGFYYLGDLSSQPFINFNHNIFFGANYHFIKNNNDLYIGVQPGVSFTQIKPNDTQNKQYSNRISVNPLISISIGYNFFVSKYFYFFVQNKYVHGENILVSPFNMSDVRLSAGLGFHI